MNDSIKKKNSLSLAHTHIKNCWVFYPEKNIGAYAICTYKFFWTQIPLAFYPVKKGFFFFWFLTFSRLANFQWRCTGIRFKWIVGSCQFNIVVEAKCGNRREMIFSTPWHRHEASNQNAKYIVLNKTKGESHSSGVWYVLVMVMVVARAHGPFFYTFWARKPYFHGYWILSIFFLFIFIPLIERKCKLIYWIKSKMVFVLEIKKPDEAFQAQIDDESQRIHIYEVRFCHFLYFGGYNGCCCCRLHWNDTKKNIFDSNKMKRNGTNTFPNMYIDTYIYMRVHGRRMNIHRRKLRNSNGLQFDWLKSI